MFDGEIGDRNAALGLPPNGHLLGVDGGIVLQKAQNLIVHFVTMAPNFTIMMCVAPATAGRL